MPILKLENISKSFGAIKALNDVSLSINPGEVLGLMGDNGAGKSTLIKIIAGNFKPTSGNLIFNEQEVEFSKPMDARNKGIEVVYQDLALCDNLTAASNIFLTREIKKKFGFFSIINFNKMFERSREIFKDLKSETLPEEEVKMMSGGQRQAIALARCFIRKPKILVLDEPTSAMDGTTEQKIINNILSLEYNPTIIISTHRTNHLNQVDKIGIMGDGKILRYDNKDKIINQQAE